MSDFHCVDTVKGRRARRCEECGRMMEVGERQAHYRGVCEGDFYSCRTCEPCYRLRLACFAEFKWYGDEAPPFGRLLEFAVYEFAEGASPAFWPEGARTEDDLIRWSAEQKELLARIDQSEAA